MGSFIQADSANGIRWFGLATARLLAARGAKVVLVSRSADRLESISREIAGSLAVPADMTKGDEVRAMIKRAREHFGRIDILINNAGQGYDAPVEKIDIDTFYHVFSLDVVGPLIAMQEAIPVMKEQGGGMIVNISSGTALMYLPNMGAYSSLKRALSGMSLTARGELKKDNIVVSVVYPYITLTDFEKNTIRHHAENREPREGSMPFKPDTAEYVAERILDGIESEEDEIFAHDWMKERRK
jgi:short-subunit dehydrogenase